MGGGLRNKLDKVHGGMTVFACQRRGVGLSLEDNKSDFAEPPPPPPPAPYTKKGKPL